MEIFSFLEGATNQYLIDAEAFSDGVLNEMQQMSNYFKESDAVVEQMMESIYNQNENIQSLSGQVDSLSMVSERLNKMIHKLKL